MFLYPLSFLPEAAPAARYTLSLHDALPIFAAPRRAVGAEPPRVGVGAVGALRGVPDGEEAAARLVHDAGAVLRSEEHTSELQSPCNLVCRLLLEKKKKNKNTRIDTLDDTHT